MDAFLKESCTSGSINATDVSVCEVAKSLVSRSHDIDIFYTLICGALVFFMQCGFAMLCAGSVRQKNVKNIMLKNLLDACGGALGFWSIGFALSYGTGGDFVGTSSGEYFLNDYDNYIFFFFQFTFAATAATIVAGTVAERCQMAAYLCYSIMLTAFIYPVVVHAIWNEDGFLSAARKDKLLDVGMIDFAGSGVVHMTGGLTALVAAIILGPRKGRFHDEDGNILPEPVSFPPHSVSLQVLGTFILWVGWYGFNPGSTLSIIGNGDVAALCAVTTTLSAASGCASALFFDTMMGMKKTGEAEYDLSMAMNGCLGGLVGITAGCAVVEPWAAVVIGLISGIIYALASKLLIKLRIDDAVDAIPVHLFNGMWGCIATGLFAVPSRAADAAFARKGGLFYDDANLLGAEICGILFILAWVVGTMVPFFMMLNALGMLRVDSLEEEVGLDISHHKGAAYMMEGPSAEVAAEYSARKSTQHGKVDVGDDDLSSVE